MLRPAASAAGACTSLFPSLLTDVPTYHRAAFGLPYDATWLLCGGASHDGSVCAYLAAFLAVCLVVYPAGRQRLIPPTLPSTLRLPLSISSSFLTLLNLSVGHSIGILHSGPRISNYTANRDCWLTAGRQVRQVAGFTARDFGLWPRFRFNRVGDRAIPLRYIEDAGCPFHATLAAGHNRRPQYYL